MRPLIISALWRPRGGRRLDSQCELRRRRQLSPSEPCWSVRARRRAVELACRPGRKRASERARGMITIHCGLNLANAPAAWPGARPPAGRVESRWRREKIVCFAVFFLSRAAEFGRIWLARRDWISISGRSAGRGLGRARERMTQRAPGPAAGSFKKALSFGQLAGRRTSTRTD